MVSIKAQSVLCPLFRDTPFPLIQLLAGGNPDERFHALESINADILVVPGGLGDIVASRWSMFREWRSIAVETSRM
ncbi:hypothetical protein PQR75_04660 [Paraburkholderia fungorum]|uniref:hypothetical protein n=1 Tax=Paraburkholderia fungorum TaxID=134537 RepID=UPI0038B7A16D